MIYFSATNTLKLYFFLYFFLCLFILKNAHFGEIPERVVNQKRKYKCKGGKKFCKISIKLRIAAWNCMNFMSTQISNT